MKMFSKNAVAHFLPLATVALSFAILGNAQLVNSPEFRVPVPGEYSRICALPSCGPCPSVEELQAPGIGLSLEIGHGTAAVRLHDGTVHNVALVEGDVPYAELMRQLAIGPISRVPSHFDSNWEKLQYTKARAQRLLNKAMGRPATSQTAVLASMVSSLLEAAQSWLGDNQPIAKAVLTSPDRIRLTDEELGDIFDYLKVQNLMDGSPPLYQIYTISAAYAGYGKGLCRNYLDAYECEIEESEFSMQRLLHLDLSADSLSGNLKSLNHAREGIADMSFVDPDLGMTRRAAWSQYFEDDEQVWILISDRIRNFAKIVKNFAFMPHLTVLILTGPSAADVRFHAAIRAALHDLVSAESVLASFERDAQVVGDEQDWHSFFAFATARGAAETAKRMQEGPGYCAQSDECRQRREDVHRQPRPPSLSHQWPEDLKRTI